MPNPASLAALAPTLARAELLKFKTSPSSAPIAPVAALASTLVRPARFPSSDPERKTSLLSAAAKRVALDDANVRKDRKKRGFRNTASRFRGLFALKRDGSKDGRGANERETAFF